MKWTGAANKEFQGPNDGPIVVPGRYAVRVTLNGRTFVQHFMVKPDPKATETLAQMRQSYAEGSLKALPEVPTAP